VLLDFFDVWFSGSFSLLSWLVFGWYLWCASLKSARGDGLVLGKFLNLFLLFFLKSSKQTWVKLRENQKGGEKKSVWKTNWENLDIFEQKDSKQKSKREMIRHRQSEIWVVVLEAFLSLLLLQLWWNYKKKIVSKKKFAKWVINVTHKTRKHVQKKMDFYGRYVRLIIWL
jgi:hypothetical protein